MNCSEASRTATPKSSYPNPVYSSSTTHIVLHTSYLIDHTRAFFNYGLTGLASARPSARGARTSLRTYAAKELHFNTNGEALKRMQAGVDKLASVVGVTLGPKVRSCFAFGLEFTNANKNINNI